MENAPCPAYHYPPRTQLFSELWRESAIPEVITGQEITEFEYRSLSACRTQPFSNF